MLTLIARLAMLSASYCLAFIEVTWIFGDDL